MPLSRPVLLALVGAILVLAAFFATQGAREPASGSDPATKVAAAEPAKPAAKPKAATAKAEPKPATPAASRPARKVAAPAGLPAPVARAVRSGKVTLLFFRQANGADDAATARAVAAQRSRGVAVFSASIKDLDRYRAVVADLGLTQAPAVVILGKDRNARVLEGFIDVETLAQEVADSR